MPKSSLKLRTVLNETMQHTGTKPDVTYVNGEGLELHTEYQVTDCMRPILSVKERRDKGQCTVFSPGLCKIIKDPNAIADIEKILGRTQGFFNIERKRSLCVGW